MEREELRKLLDGKKFNVDRIVFWVVTIGFAIAVWVR